MRHYSIPLLSAGLIVAATTGFPATVSAGFPGAKTQNTNAPTGKIIHQTQFKISGSKTRKRLRNQGYNNILIEHRGVSKVIATACKNGEKFRLRVGRSGKVRSSEQIGYCGNHGPRIQPQEVVDYLRTSGYHHIDITSKGPPTYTVEACEQNKRFSLKIDRRGAIVGRTPIGRCGGEHRRPPVRQQHASRIPNHVIDRLHNKGFSEIVVFDDTLPEYGAEACKDGKRFELTLNRRGQIMRREGVGRCYGGRPSNPRPQPYARGVSPQEAKQALRDQGFRRIRMIDESLPVYVAKACRDGRRFRLKMNRNATITDVQRIGRCRLQTAHGNMSPKEIRYDLRSRGFNRIEFVKRTPPIYRVEACRNDRRHRLKIDRTGAIVERAKIGKCRDDDNATGYVNTDIQDILKSRRYYNIKLHQKSVYDAEVCRNGRKFRLKIDRFGNELKRDRIGWCDARDYARTRYDRDHYPRHRITDADLDSRDRLAPSRCQDYIDWLLENNSINFDTASAQINPESVPLLKRLAHVANRCPATNIEIAGHTDSDGSDEDNQYLSERRAQSVVRFLRDHNVERSRLNAMGYGETRPLAPNDTPWNKALNRRIEFVVTWADDWRFSRR